MKRSFYLALIFAGLSYFTPLSAAGVQISAAHTDESLDALAGGCLIQTRPINLSGTSTLCQGSTVVVEFTASGTYNSGNVFTAQLSDASGSFASPTNIGSLPFSGVMPVSAPGVLGAQSYIYSQIPSVPFGTQYRIRVISSDPENIEIGCDNGTNLTIKNDIAPPIPGVVVNGPHEFCNNSATTFLLSLVTGNHWFPDGSSTNPFLLVTGTGCYYTQINGANGCATSSIPECFLENTGIIAGMFLFEEGSKVSPPTSDSTVLVCEGDSIQLGIIISGGTPPYDVVYTADGGNTFITIEDVPEGPYSFFVDTPGTYQLIGLTDNFSTNCGGTIGTSGAIVFESTPRPVASFAYNSFCGSVSQAPVLAPGSLPGGVFSFDPNPGDGATVDPETGIISGAFGGTTYNVSYIAEGPFCSAEATASITPNDSDIVSFDIVPFCASSSSAAPVTAAGFAIGGTFSFADGSATGATIDPLTGIISNASIDSIYIIMYESAEGVCQGTFIDTVTTLPAPAITESLVTNTTCTPDTGSIEIISINGGPVDSFTFSWSNGDTTSTIDSLDAGSYTLMLTDPQGCVLDTSFTIINTNLPIITLTPTPATCGGSNGEITVTADPESVNYVFDWSNDSTTQNLSGLSVGTYTVIITDTVTTCVVSGSATIINEAAPVFALDSIVNSLCGQSLGSIFITVTGGEGTITHSWTNGAETEDLEGVAAGTYTDTITDANGCQVLFTGTIENTNEFVATGIATQPTCANPGSGVISVTIAGGALPFLYSVNGEEPFVSEDNEFSISDLTPGAYEIIITGAAQCIDTVSLTIAPVNTITLSADTTSSTCGNEDGAIDLTVTGGSGSYTYIWSNADSTQDISSLTPGTYSVTVIDSVDSTCTASLQVTIINGNLFHPEIAITNSCLLNSGVIAITIPDGSGDFDFDWSGPGAFTDSTATIDSLATGTYNLTITDNVTGCSIDTSATIIFTNTLPDTVTVLNTTCGLNNGLIDITIDESLFTFSWSDDTSATLDRINLAPGIYILTLTNDESCVRTDTFTIAPSIQPTSSEPVIVNPSCGNDTGSVSITLINATAPVSWMINGSSVAHSADVTDTEINVDSLAAGNYVITATDGGGCIVSNSVTLINPDQPFFENLTITNTECGLATGQLDIDISGGSGGFSFTLINEQGDSIPASPGVSDLPFGCYTIIVDDANGCSVDTAACIRNNNSPVITLDVVQPSCGQDNGTITAIITTGVPPYTITWTGSADTDSMLTNLSAGTYTILVVDSNGCQSDTSVTLINTGVPILTAEQINTTCGNSIGEIHLVVTGGLLPYDFDWSNDSTTADITGLPVGTYTVIVTDSAGCSVPGQFHITNTDGIQASVTNLAPATCGASNGAISVSVSGGSGIFTFQWTGTGVNQDSLNQTGLAAGNYSFVVTDDFTGCVDSMTITISDQGFSVESIITDAGCGQDNGEIALTITGGTAPFTIVYCDGILNGAASEVTISGVSAGLCELTITDANDCSQTLSLTVGGGNAPQATFTQVNTTCGNDTGSVNVTVTGGVLPYTFEWQFNNGVIADTTEDLDSLAVGSYILTITDSAGCSTTLNFSIINSDAPVITGIVATPSSCGDSTGTITVNVTNLLPGAIFSWTGPDGFTSSEQNLDSLAPGTYVVTITSGACDPVIDSATITNTDAPSASLSLSTDTLCSGSSATLSIALTGTGPFTIVYNNGILPVTVTSFEGTTFTVDVNPTSTTIYSLVSLISDSNPACTGTLLADSATVVVNPTPTTPVITPDGPLTFCQGDSVILTSSALTGNNWNVAGADSSDQSITVTTSGTFFVTVTNAFGCSAVSESVSVIVGAGGTIFAGNDTTVCAGQPVQLQATGGGPDYVWSPSIYLSGTIIPNPVAIPFETTTYTVTSDGACGSATGSITITVLPIIDATLGPDQDVCFGSEVILTVPQVAGGIYNWSPASAIIGNTTGNSVVVNTTGNAQIILQTQNTNGCIDTDTVQINIVVPADVLTIQAEGPTTFCEGGSVILSASTGNLVLWSNGLENFDSIEVTQSGFYSAILQTGVCPALSDTIEVVVTPAPQAIITIEGSPALCPGTCATLSAVQANNISWILPDGTTTQNAVQEACTAGQYILIVTEGTCEGRDTINITVLPPIDQPVITPNGLVTICENETVVLISSYQGEGNQWTVNGFPITGGTTTAYETNLPGAYTVIVTTPEGCVDTSEATVITVKPVTPIEILTPSGTVFCNGQTANLPLNASSGFTSYTWDPTGQTSQNIIASTAGTYTVTGVNAEGCSAEASVTIIQSDPFTVDLTSTVFFDDFNISVIGGSDGLIFLTTEGGSGNFTYQWSNGSTDQNLTGLPAGTYTVTVSDELGCQVSDSITLKEPSNIVLPNGFTPNGDGFNDFYVIKGIQGYPQNEVKIFNRWGDLVYSKNTYTNDWNGVSNDGNVLTDGTYFIVLNLNTEGTPDQQGFIDLRRNN